MPVAQHSVHPGYGEKIAFQNETDNEWFFSLILFQFEYLEYPFNNRQKEVAISPDFQNS